MQHQIDCTSEPTGSFSSLEALEIDPRSFHVFEYQGDRLLFDRATGTTSGLNDLAFTVLQQIQEGTPLPKTMDAISANYPDLDAAGVLLALHDLKQRGFFRFEEAHHATEQDLEYLWNHKPRRIQMLMAEGCNLGCRYCYQWRNGTNQKHTLMPWPVAKQSVDYLVWRSGNRNDLQVTFFGGEPLLNYPMIKRVVNYCKTIEKTSNKQFTFELITNGTLLSEDVVDFIVEHRFLLFISLDGWREMHEYNRPAMDGQGSYDTIVRNAVYANKQYEKHKLPLIKIRANLTNRYHDKKKVSQFFEELGFKLIGIGPIEPLPHGDPSPAALTEEQMDALAEKSEQDLLDVVETLKRREHVGPFEMRKLHQARRPLKKNGTLGVTCGVCRNTTVVDNRGNMYPCHRYGEMQEYVIGHISSGLDRALVMKYYQKINAHTTKDCHDCWIRDYCSGGCAWLLSDKEGNIHHPTKAECTRRRKSMEQRLWLRKDLRENFPGWMERDEETSIDSWDWNEKFAVPEKFSNCTEEEDLAGVQFVQLSSGLNQQNNTASPGCSSCSEASSGSCGCSTSSEEGQFATLVPLTDPSLKNKKE
ncbi:radical SAM/SPASM domain-containing protein [Gimesia fumaroli]|jgi:uncharacterized protein|uniref:Radical SAM core domain-containing protein n=1 Tax=Gimesia fumaroli TaxID=2527976 RepID=A0A518IGY5_9PLAN|nr:radical SAM protein [Gimesia fumaroli]QDV52352.1 hypothetical protein Enr17x_44140 [Gimesia fumaroli]